LHTLKRIWAPTLSYIFTYCSLANIGNHYYHYNHHWWWW
jgi:hypothetical protein